MRVERLVVGALSTNCWLVSDEQGGPLLVIDPGGTPEEVLPALRGRDVAMVVLTHRHFDHLGAVRELLDATGAPLAMHPLDAAFVGTPEGTGGAMFGFTETAPEPDVLLDDGDTVKAGVVELSVLSTPGHSAGSISLYAPGHLFSGDLLFAGSVGRSDFESGDSRTLARSLAEKIAPLPDDTVVHPGHGPDTTVGGEKRTNVFFPRNPR